MRTYSIMLPIFGELSPNLKKFITSTASTGDLQNYLTKYCNKRLKFIPLGKFDLIKRNVQSCCDEKKGKLKSYSISEKTLINDLFSAKDISKFASDFNIFASLVVTNKSENHIKLVGNLIKLPAGYSKLKYALIFTLTMEDEVKSKLIDDLFSSNK